MTGHHIAIGSRGSLLALAQARLVQESLDPSGTASRVVIIETDGDRRAPDTAWGEGAFVTMVERALLTGDVDIAVHSAKDVPTEEDPHLRIGAYLSRADPRDALVVRDDATDRRLDDLPAGTRVGTDSPRRTGFLLARRPDLVVHPVHGNIDTRLRRLDAGETDALVLACAGLDRIGLAGRIAERIAPEIVPPAAGQGAIAIQVRRDDVRMNALVAAVDHGDTRLAVEAEREFLRASGGGCRAPIGAFARIEGSSLELLAGFALPDGSAARVARRRGALIAGEHLAHELAQALDPGDRIRAMAQEDATQGDPGPSRTRAPRILVTRPRDQADALISALRAAGLDPVPVPTIAVEIDPPHGELDAAARCLHTYGWVVITSVNGARAILKAAERVFTALETPRWAAIGAMTRLALESEGIEVEFQPSEASSHALAEELPVLPGEQVLVLRGDLADEELPLGLRARGAWVDPVVAYRTREAPERAPESPCATRWPEARSTASSSAAARPCAVSSRSPKLRDSMLPRSRRSASVPRPPPQRRPRASR